MWIHYNYNSNFFANTRSVILCSKKISMNDFIRPCRIRGNSLPPEYEMAYFIQPIANPHESWTTHTPVCSWLGVKCVDSRVVSHISWQGMLLRGSVRWEHTPPHVTHINLGAGRYEQFFRVNYLNGPLPLGVLPRTLVLFSVFHAQYHGELDMTVLPPELRLLDLKENFFSGTLDLTQLPSTLEILSLSGNSFVGEINFLLLPTRLKRLDILGAQVVPKDAFVPPRVVLRLG